MCRLLLKKPRVNPNGRNSGYKEHRMVLEKYNRKSWGSQPDSHVVFSKGNGKRIGANVPLWRVHLQFCCWALSRVSQGDEVLGQSHRLKARVLRLEAELPFVEKELLSETNHTHYAYSQGRYPQSSNLRENDHLLLGFFRFLLVSRVWCYRFLLACHSDAKIPSPVNTGSKWHSSLPYEPKSCTQGDLPHFLRHFYEECQPPPCLSLHDKYALNIQFPHTLLFPSFANVGWSNLLLLDHTQ